MGQTRQQPGAPQGATQAPQRSFPEAEAAIALILMGAVAVPNPLATITLILIETLRSVRVPSTDLDSIARSAAGMATREASGEAGPQAAGSGEGAGPRPGDASVVGRDGSGDQTAEGGGPGDGDALPVAGGDDSGGFDRSLLPSLLGDVRVENFIRRAQFVIGAARRMALRLRSGMAISESILQEEFNFRLHREAQGQRLRATQLQVSLMDTYGTSKFIWHHSKKIDYRPTHKRADGKVYDALNPPKSTLGLPATLPFCGCSGEPVPQETSVTLI